MSTKFEDLIMRGSAASQPAAGVPGRLYYDTTNSKLQRDNGTTWEDVEPPATIGDMPKATYDADDDGVIDPGALGTGARDGTKYLRDDGTWQAVSDAGGDVVGPVSATDGHLAVFDGTTGKLLKDGGAVPAGSGGGGGTYDEVYASPPATPAAGDLWFPSDSPLMARYSGSAWLWRYGSRRITPPPTADWAWTNQGTATVNTNGGLLHVYNPAVSGDQRRLYTRALPAAPYTVTMLVSLHYHVVNFNQVGVAWLENASGKHVAVETNEGGQLRVSRWTGSSFSGQYMNTGTFPFSALLWIRLADDNTNRLVSWSLDGSNFIPLHSVARTDFITADRVGIVVNSNSSAYPVAVTLYSWTVT